MTYGLNDIRAEILSGGISWKLVGGDKEIESVGRSIFQSY